MEVNSFNGQEGVKSSREIELLEAILATLQRIEARLDQESIIPKRSKLSWLLHLLFQQKRWLQLV